MLLAKNILFLSDEGPMLETLDYILSVLAVHRPFYISICISLLCLRSTLRLFQHSCIAH